MACLALTQEPPGNSGVDHADVLKLRWKMASVAGYDEFSARGQCALDDFGVIGIARDPKPLAGSHQDPRFSQRLEKSVDLIPVQIEDEHGVILPCIPPEALEKDRSESFGEARASK
jgi:hypothetical protein